MASIASTAQTQPAAQRSRLRITGRAFSLRTAIIVFLGLLILFRWLHLILALQLASTGRQIQISTGELHQIERTNATLVRRISEAEAPASLGNRAIQQGYGPSTLLYLRTSVPIAQTTPGPEEEWASHEVQTGFTTRTNSVTPWDALSREIGVNAQAETAP